MQETIICDVDGVIVDLQKAWLARYNKDYNDNVTSEDVITWDTHKYVKPECGLKYYDYLEDPTLYDEVLPFNNGGLQFCNKMRDIGYRIVFATVTPFATAGVKLKLLIKYGYLDATQKKDYVEIIDKTLLRGVANILIDDAFHNTLDWYLSGGTPILFTRKHNEKNIVPYFHTNDWDKIFDICCGGYSV